MLYDLLRMDLRDWHPRYDVPKTTALRDQQTLSLLAEDQWWFELLKTATLPKSRYNTQDNPRRALSRDLYTEARRTVPALRYSSDHLLGRILGKRNRCTPCRLHGLHAWEFPALTEARAAWDKRMPGTDWDNQEEWATYEAWEDNSSI